MTTNVAIGSNYSRLAIVAVLHLCWIVAIAACGYSCYLDDFHPDRRFLGHSKDDVEVSLLRFAEKVAGIGVFVDAASVAVALLMKFRGRVASVSHFVAGPLLNLLALGFAAILDFGKAISGIGEVGVRYFS